MSADWKELTLADIAEPKGGLVDGPFGSNLPASCYVEEGVPVIRGGNLTVGLERFKPNDFVYVSNETLGRIKRSTCFSNDIVFTKKGTLGQTGLVPSDSRHDRYLLSSNQMRLRVNTNLADPEYVYYWVSSKASIAKIKRDSEFTGVPKINLEYLKKFPITIPKLTIQKRIAKILSGFDRKIELNRQINQTLEAMAQTIFKSWFVDFKPVKAKIAAIEAGEEAEGVTCAAMRVISGKTDDELDQMQAEQPDHYTQLKNTAEVFPASMQELGEVPSGWEMSCFGNVIVQCKKKIKDRSATVLSAVARGQLVRSDEHFKKTVYSKSIEKYLAVEKWDFAYNPSRINIGSIGMYKKDELGAVSPVYVVFRPSADYRWFIEFSLRLNKTKNFINKLASGGVRQSLSFNDFASIPSVIPSKDCISIFNLLLEKLEAFSESQINEINTLNNLQDTLLPKLLSGELSVDAAKLVEEN